MIAYVLMKFSHTMNKIVYLSWDASSDGYEWTDELRHAAFCDFNEAVELSSHYNKNPVNVVPVRIEMLS